MESDFWLNRWKTGETGWHEKEVNPLLEQYLPKFNLQAGASVFVPLCGKSNDLLWLAKRGYKAIGVELSKLAVNDFFRDNKIPFTKKNTKDEKVEACFSANELDLMIYLGDFFAIPDGLIGECQFVYDRAAVIALPEEMRTRYVAKMTDELREGAMILLVTLEHPGDSGPPFCVTEDQLRALYGDAFSIEVLGKSEEEFNGHMNTNVAYKLVKQRSRL